VRVLAIVRHYLPLYQTGGPARTLANMVERLGDEFQFRIVTSSREGPDGSAHAVVQVDRWNRVGKAEVCYVSPPNRSVRGLAKLIRTTPHDVLYINSFFDSVFTVKAVIARRLGLLPRVPVILAPRGEFSPAALTLDRWRKVPYLAASRRLGLYRDMVWQASSDFEASDIRRSLGEAAEPLHVAPNLPRPATPDTATDGGRSRGDVLRIVFLSRIVPMKNLAYALQVLRRVRVPIEFNIYGPVRDTGYWSECQRLLAALPDTAKGEYRGEVPSADVPDVLRAHDLFFLPTRGENYGHAIAEALSVGTPVLIADTTSWRGLEEAGVGWDLPLGDPDRFARCVEDCARLPAEAYAAWRERVRRYAAGRGDDERAVEANRRLFESAVAR
jgi:glycosyltransferase involved in cell wall biosynthesis